MFTETIVSQKPAARIVRSVRAKLAGLDGLIEKTGALMQFGCGAEIYSVGEPTDYLYKVVRGAVRRYKILTDGRRQVESFYLPGDVFGFELGGEHSLSAEKTINSKLIINNDEAQRYNRAS